MTPQIVLPRTTNHLIWKVLPAATDYREAESALSEALQRELGTAQAATLGDWTLALVRCEQEAQLARRRAAEFAIAVDGLTDRASLELDEGKPVLSREISSRCFWPGSLNIRLGAFDRVRAIANAYKHYKLSDPGFPIGSDDDILVVGAPYGADDYGVGKYAGVEVLVRETKTGDVRKFLADAPVVVGAWLTFLKDRGAPLPVMPYLVCGLNVSPF